MKSKTPELCVIGGERQALQLLWRRRGLSGRPVFPGGNGFGAASPRGEKAACNGQRPLQLDQPARFSSRLF